MEVRLTLDDELMTSMMRKTGATKATDITRDALALFQWAVDQAAAGRDVMSTDGQGTPERVTMPSLRTARSRALKR